MPTLLCRRLLLGAVFLCMPVLAVAQKVEVQTYRQSNAHDIIWFGSLLRAGADRPLQSATLAESMPVGARSHLHMTYQSALPLPVRIVFPDAASDHQLVAVLPASPAGDVRLSLTGSPAWRQTMEALDIEIYWVGETPPTLTGLTTENRLSFMQSLCIYIRQLFQPESFSSFSLGTIYGYRIAGYPVTVIAGISLLLLTALLCVWQRKRSVFLMMAVVWVPALLLYETRFLADIIVATVTDQAAWRSAGTYSDMRFLYAQGEEIKKQALVSTVPISVASCTGLATPLRYVVYPIPVSGDEEEWKTATFGVVQGVWDAEQTEFSCKGIRRAGTIVRTFPSGEAIVRFTLTP